MGSTDESSDLADGLTRAMKRYFGCHVSTAGGLHRALVAGDQLGVNTIQIHPSAPQRWNVNPFPVGYEEPYLAAKKDSKVEKVFFHGIYLINLANPDPKHFHLSKTSLIHDLDLCARLGAQGVIFHVGSLKHENSEAAGLKRAAEGINRILEGAPNEAKLLLEVAAGSGATIGDRMEELAAIYEQIEERSRVGFALDTQHLFASGYDLQHDLEGIVSQVESIFTMEKVWAIHLNDSKTALASRKDRHENLGQGLIGAAALQAFFQHRKLQPIPFILETPAMKFLETARHEVEILRSWQ